MFSFGVCDHWCSNLKHLHDRWCSDLKCVCDCVYDHCRFGMFDRRCTELECNHGRSAVRWCVITYLRYVMIGVQILSPKLTTTTEKRSFPLRSSNPAIWGSSSSASNASSRASVYRLPKLWMSSVGRMAPMLMSSNFVGPFRKCFWA